MQISEACKNRFELLLKELARSYKLYIDDRDAYFTEMKKDNLILTCIDAPSDLRDKINKKRQSQTPCFYQLYRTGLSSKITLELANLLHKNNLSYCFPNEFIDLVEDITYEYVNTDLNCFIDYIIQNEDHGKIQFDVLKKIGRRRLNSLKKEFTVSVFQFPLMIFNLNGELQLSKHIRLVPTGLSDLTDEEFSRFAKTRTFDSNYYLEICLQTKCSNNLALHLAEKARDSIYNVLRLLATRLSPRAIPLLASSEKHPHLFDFYKHGKDLNSMNKAITYKFPSLHFDSKDFWKVFHEERALDKNLIDIALQIPELLLLPNISNPRVVERLERSMLWYGDAVTESNFYLQVQKLVSSLEALVNFNEGDVTETFKRRVTHLNINHTGLNEEIREKANQLYDARSKIIHGSSTDERLNFCIIDFCSETLLRAIFYFSLFGFEKTGFNNKLPEFLDELPKQAVLRCD